MKFKQEVTVNILSRKSMGVKEDFYARFKHHHQCLPQLMPEKWGYGEPSEFVFNPECINDIKIWIPSWENGFAQRVSWKKAKKIKSEGAFDCRWMSAVPEILLDTHAIERMSLELNTFPQNDMTRYVCESSVLYEVDIAIIDTCSDYYYEHQKYVYEEYQGTSFIGKSVVGLMTHALRHWLSDIYWVTVFGKAYVNLFGRERILSVPAYRVEQLSDDVFVIQLTPNLSDVIDDPVGTMAIRERVKQHLGREAFFSVDKAYPLKGPLSKADGTIDMEESRNFERPDPIGTVFKVPHFELLEDEYTRYIRQKRLLDGDAIGKS